MFKHPNNVCMTYFEHMALSLYFSYTLMVGSCKAFIHAFIPDVYITTTSDVSSEISTLLKESGCRK